MIVDTPLHLFQGYGIELEYMLVDADTLNVLPRTDEVLKCLSGEYTDEVERGALRWSNELMLHVIEFKTNGPAAHLPGLSPIFHNHVNEAGALVKRFGGRIMPTAMHPWMHPDTEARLWPHEYSPIYEAFHRIFDCRGHGWSNLQSLHINLPFDGDGEFARLHAAIRMVLPLLPALAASSPIVEGRLSPYRDHRLHVYRYNAARIPSVTGEVVPEPVYSQRDYAQHVLGRMYSDIAPLDPDGVLQFEWLNARGAIARFERNTIEVRVLDVQECPRADLAIALMVCKTIEALVRETWLPFDRQKAWATGRLAAILDACVERADEARVEDGEYLADLGMPWGKAVAAGEVWRHLYEAIVPALSTEEQDCLAPIETILNDGSLSRRIVRAVGEDPAHERLHEVYGALCDCLDSNTLFRGR